MRSFLNEKLHSKDSIMEETSCGEFTISILSSEVT